jgi:hypothetical protein
MRPRYGIGFPLLLAGALELGLAPDRLWWVTAFSDAALAALVALGAGALVLAAARTLEGEPWRAAGRARAAAALAAALGGLVVALAPWHLRHGKLLHSDSPVVLAATLAALAWCAGLLAPNRARSAALSVGAGALFGWIATARSVEAALLAPALALAPLLLGERSLARLARGVAFAAAGAALPVAIAAAPLVRSGAPPLAWSDYHPSLRVGDADADLFDGRWVVEPSPVGAGRRAAWPGWKTAVSTVTGIPVEDLAPGPVWPAAGWATLGALLLLLRGREGSRARGLAALLVVAGVWSLAHALFFPFYFFHARRFYLVPAHVATLLAAAGAGLLVFAAVRPGGRLRPGRALAGAAGLALGLAIALTTLSAYRREAERRGTERSVGPRIERRLERWLARPEGRRGDFPLDPVHAQALGLLDRKRAESIRDWGELAPSPQVRRIERLRREAGEPSREPSRE